MNKQTLKWVIYGALFLIPFVPFLVSSSFFFPFITSKAFAFRILVEVALSAWVVLALLDAKYRPRRSLILYSLFIFLAIIGLADLLGEAPLKSFWSNYERMEGYITLLHLGAFFLVAGSVFRDVSAVARGSGEASWRRWWNTSLVASLVMVFYGMFQLAGVVTINQGGVRVDGTLGNASYLAVYMLFHIFIALWLLFREQKNGYLRWTYGALILLQTYILYHTATRGAILGLLGGVLVVSLLNLRNTSSPRLRKFGITYVVAVVVLVGGFLAFKNSSFVQESPVLARFASISSEELKGGGRSFVWPMAIKGIAERPLLGWGQDNFNYVFNEHYDAEMYRLEPWFDRAHNIFLDWGIAGGVLGLLSYLSLYFVLLYLLWKRDENFSYEEKTILTGLVSAYFFHNLFVFDNLISYILFFALLAYVHSRSEGEFMFDGKGNLPAGARGAGSRQVPSSLAKDQQASFLLAGTMVAFILVVYFINIKPIRANLHLLSALAALQGGSPNHELSMTQFRLAYEGAWLGRTEVVEQVTSNSTAILNSGVDLEKRNEFFGFARDITVKQADIFSTDVRLQLVAGSFLVSTGDVDQGLDYLNRAKKLSPNKQQVYYETGSALINNSDLKGALEEFKTAYELAPENVEAKVIYLVGAIYVGDRTLESKIFSELPQGIEISDRRILSAYVASKRSLEAISILRKIGNLDPASKPQADKYIELIQSGQY